MGVAGRCGRLQGWGDIEGSRSRQRSAAGVPALAALLLLAGCGVSFPKEELVQDLRILNIRVDPPEIPIFARPVIDAEPEDLVSLETSTQTVTLTALVAHPDLDATFELEWIRCRNGQTGQGFERVPCGGASKERLGAGAPVTIDPVRMLIDDLATTRAGLEEAVAGLASDPRDLFNGLRLFVNLEARVASAGIDVDTEQLQGTKRLLLFDPTVVAVVIREARARSDDIPTIEGLDLPSLCTNVDDDQLAVIYDVLRRYTPNRSPVYHRLEYLGPTETTTKTWEPGDEPIEVLPGERVELTGHADPSSIDSGNVIDNKCRVRAQPGELSYSWFTTAGQLSMHVSRATAIQRTAVRGGALTAVRSSIGHTVYTAPPSPALERDVTRVRVWSVLRDGRGGSDSRYLDLVIRKGG